jgi:threonine/homoserine/homoserine lactone efflux protein
MEARQGVGATITLIFSALSLTNMPYPHIARARYMRFWTWAGTACWIGGVAIGTFTLPHHYYFVRVMLYVGGAYFIVLAGIRSLHDRRAERAKVDSTTEAR